MTGCITGKFISILQNNLSLGIEFSGCYNSILFSMFSAYLRAGLLASSFYASFLAVYLTRSLFTLYVPPPRESCQVWDKM